MYGDGWKTGIHWRDTARRLRFFGLDARVLAALLIWAAHFCWETFCCALAGLIVFGLLEVVGLTPMSFVRMARTTLTDPRISHGEAYLQRKRMTQTTWLVCILAWLFVFPMEASASYHETFVHAWPPKEARVQAPLEVKPAEQKKTFKSPYGLIRILGSGKTQPITGRVEKVPLTMALALFLPAEIRLHLPPAVAVRPVSLKAEKLPLATVLNRLGVQAKVAFELNWRMKTLSLAKKKDKKVQYLASTAQEKKPRALPKKPKKVAGLLATVARPTQVAQAPFCRKNNIAPSTPLPKGALVNRKEPPIQKQALKDVKTQKEPQKTLDRPKEKALTAPQEPLKAANHSSLQTRKDFAVEKGSLKEQLRSWCTQADYTLIWAPSHDYTLSREANFGPNFAMALKSLLDELSLGGLALRATLYQANAVLYVEED